MQSRLTIERLQRKAGFTAVDLLTVIGVLAMLAFVVWPAIEAQSRRRTRCCRVSCASNLKQVGLALRMWANDNQAQFPWAVSTNEGGTRELVATSVFPHFRALSNELTSPKVLACSSDTARTRARTWDQITNDTDHISYFLGLSVDETRPQMVLSGDRNLTTNGQPAFGTVTLTRTLSMGWTPALHRTHGNVGLADGSAQQMTAATLRQQVGTQFASITNAAVLLAIP